MRSKKYRRNITHTKREIYKQNIIDLNIKKDNSLGIPKNKDLAYKYLKEKSFLQLKEILRLLQLSPDSDDKSGASLSRKQWCGRKGYHSGTRKKTISIVMKDDPIDPIER